MKEEQKKYINNFIFWIKNNSKIVLIWIFLFLIFILFQDRIASIIANNSIIGENEVKNKSFYILYLIMKWSIFGLIFYTFFSNYRLSKQTKFWLLFVSVTYFILKINIEDNLFFYKLENSNDNYADVLLLLGTFVIILSIRNYFKNFLWFDNIKTFISKELYFSEQEEFSELKEDIPIDGSIPIDSDSIANTLVLKINELKPLNAFVIGVNSEWGNGKSTFLKRLEYLIKYDNKSKSSLPIIFWFNAWQHQDEKSIINNFFGVLKKELSKYSGNANSSINTYLNKLLAFFDKKYSKGLNFISDEFINKNSTIKDYYDIIT